MFFVACRPRIHLAYIHVRTLSRLGLYIKASVESGGRAHIKRFGEDLPRRVYSAESTPSTYNGSSCRQIVFSPDAQVMVSEVRAR